MLKVGPPTESPQRALRHGVGVATGLAASLLALFMYPQYTFVLGGVAFTLGCLLCWAFRDAPGPVASEWHRVRSAHDPQLYRFYSASGPWLWRLGAGALAGLAIRVVAFGA